MQSINVILAHSVWKVNIGVVRRVHVATRLLFAQNFLIAFWKKDLQVNIFVFKFNLKPQCSDFMQRQFYMKIGLQITAVLNEKKSRVNVHPSKLCQSYLKAFIPVDSWTNHHLTQFKAEILGLDRTRLDY